uniref:Ubiquitin-fold modifier-conjugating enzyme 1 n=1 Tax=Gadus morhua TaxID=8049 RepID=A0A8C5CLX3_GADMO
MCDSKIPHNAVQGWKAEHFLLSFSPVPVRRHGARVHTSSFISPVVDDFSIKRKTNNRNDQMSDEATRRTVSDNDWFRLESNREGTRWFGKCWYVHELLRYEFDVEFDVPATYPATAPEVALPELEGKTAKMYRGGRICLTDHFKPLWARNVPRFGLAHLMALGLGPWLAVEIPDLVSRGLVTHKENQQAPSAS